MQFYLIDDNTFDDKYFAFGEEMDLKTGDSENCPVCGCPIGMRKWLPPLKAKLSKKKYGDFVFGTFTTFLCSDHFKNKYAQSDLNGIVEFEPVEIVKVNRKKKTDPEPPDYYLATIMISKVRIDETKSHLNREQEPTCNVCRANGIINGINGFSIDIETWNNEDIFYAVGLPGTIIVSQKFHDFIIEHGFTNLTLTRTEEYSWGVY